MVPVTVRSGTERAGWKVLRSSGRLLFLGLLVLGMLRMASAAPPEAFWQVGRAVIQTDQGSLYVKLSLRNIGQPSKLPVQIFGRWGPLQAGGEATGGEGLVRLGSFTGEVALTAILMISLQPLGSVPPGNPVLELMVVTGSKQTDQRIITFQDQQKQDLQKTGEKAPKGRHRVDGKSLHGIEKDGGKAFQDTGKSRRAFVAKKRGRFDSHANEPPADVAQEPPAGEPPTIAQEPPAGEPLPDIAQEPPAGEPLPDIAQEPPAGEPLPDIAQEPPAGEPPTDFSGEPTSYPNEQRGEPKQAPEFSLGSTEPSIQGDDRSVYDKLGISGLALPEGATGQETQGADVPRDEQVPENQSRSRRR